MVAPITNDSCWLLRCSSWKVRVQVKQRFQDRSGLVCHAVVFARPLDQRVTSKFRAKPRPPHAPMMDGAEQLVWILDSSINCLQQLLTLRNLTQFWQNYWHRIIADSKWVKSWRSLAIEQVRPTDQETRSIDQRFRNDCTTVQTHKRTNVQTYNCATVQPYNRTNHSTVKYRISSYPIKFESKRKASLKLHYILASNNNNRWWSME